MAKPAFTPFIFTLAGRAKAALTNVDIVGKRAGGFALISIADFLLRRRTWRKTRTVNVLIPPSSLIRLARSAGCGLAAALTVASCSSGGGG